MITKHINRIISSIQNKYDRESFNHEDKIVLTHLESILKNKKSKLKFLEVGSGAGRFASKIKRKYSSKIDITCIEINTELARVTQKNGLKTINADITKIGLGKNNYDIVHCSHVIEHFGYPEVIHLLDKLFAAAKVGGDLIIRTPLMHNNFFLDIDHVRPYPPDTILNYYQNIQQQVVGKIKIAELTRWYRNPPMQISFAKNRLLVIISNSLLKLSWTLLKFPCGRADGYVSVFRKL